MSSRSAQCPGCGVEIVFAHSASLLVVCEHCRYASFRRDVKLEGIGKVAQVAPIDSPIALGAQGQLGGQRFGVRGQIQLDHGAGPWNEWAIVFEDGSTAWLAEAQGQYLVTRAVTHPFAQTYSALAAGAQLDLGPHGRWVVAEKGAGRVTAIRGELPVDVRPGSSVRYLDLSGAGGGFGTLDFGAGEACQAVYLGRRHALAELGLESSGAEPRRERRVSAQRVACPKCAGAIDLRDPENAKRVGCPYCGALIDPRAEVLEVLATSELLKVRRGPPIGAKGRLFGQEFEVLAWIERSVSSDGERWPWDEYLLRRADGAYRWLVCSQKHWSFVEPLELADVQRKPQRCSWKGRTLRHFTGGMARIDRVVGEVYWEVEVGEKVRCDDYVDAPFMVSFESTDNEKLVSLATYVTGREVWDAFGLKERLDNPSSIGPAQPNPVGKHLKRFWLTALALCALVVLVAAGTQVLRRGRTLHSSGHVLSPPGAIVTEEFELPGPWCKVAVGVRAPGLARGFFALDGLFVPSEGGSSGRGTSFTIASPGPQPGEPTTGLTDSSARVVVGGLRGGRYRLRLEPHALGPETSGDFRISVQVERPALGRAVLVVVLLLLVPCLLSIATLIVEGSRWQQSDHS